MNQDRGLAEYRWCSGQHLSAVRNSGASFWMVCQPWHDQNVPISLQLQLVYGVQERDPGAVPALKGRRIELPRLSFYWIMAIHILLFVAWYMITGSMPEGLSAEDLYGGQVRLLLGGLLLSWFSLTTLDALNLSSVVQGNVPMLRLTFLGLQLEKVAWVLTQHTWLVVSSIMTPLAMWLSSLLLPMDRAFAAGVGIGSWLILFARLCPMAYGPVTSLLSIAYKIDDFPRVLRVCLSSFFMAFEGRGIKGFSLRMVIGIGISVLWFSLGIIGLMFLSSRYDAIEITGLWSLTLVSFLLWTFWHYRPIVVDALRYRQGGKKEYLNPDPAMVRRWKSSCALLRHVPALAALPWDWFRCSSGTRLVRYGEEDSSCFWIASGAVDLFGRSPEMRIEKLNSVKAGSAIGERAFLERGSSSYDVLVSETSLVACLDARVVPSLPPESAIRMRNFILASQSFDRCEQLKGMLPVAKELWLTKGKCVQIPGGTNLMNFGEECTWLGLIVNGSVLLNDALGESRRLKMHDLCGVELLQGLERCLATLITESPVLMMRWELQDIKPWIFSNEKPTTFDQSEKRKKSDVLFGSPDFGV